MDTNLLAAFQAEIAKPAYIGKTAEQIAEALNAPVATTIAPASGVYLDVPTSEAMGILLADGSWPGVEKAALNPADPNYAVANTIYRAIMSLPVLSCSNPIMMSAITEALSAAASATPPLIGGTVESELLALATPPSTTIVTHPIWFDLLLTANGGRPVIPANPHADAGPPNAITAADITAAGGPA